MRWAGGCEGERRLTGVSLPRRQLIMHLTSNAFHPSKARAMLGHGAPTPKGASAGRLWATRGAPERCTIRLSRCRDVPWDRRRELGCWSMWPSRVCAGKARPCQPRLPMPAGRPRRPRPPTPAHACPRLPERPSAPMARTGSVYRRNESCGTITL
jgi:hypothetical protein